MLFFYYIVLTKQELDRALAGLPLQKDLGDSSMKPTYVPATKISNHTDFKKNVPRKKSCGEQQ